jgi:hypothetical protein
MCHPIYPTLRITASLAVELLQLIELRVRILLKIALRQIYYEMPVMCIFTKVLCPSFGGKGGLGQ